MPTLEQRFSIHYRFPVFFHRNVFRCHDELLASVFARAGTSPHRFSCFIDSGVLEEDPGLIRRIEEYTQHNSQVMQLCGPVTRVEGGEASKADSTVVDRVVEYVKDYRLCRHSFVLAIGGGAVIDAVGYGAAIAHRGIRLIRMPTTVLAQNDAGVGVKNGINGLGRKNFIGTFAPPFAVINDFDFLATLPPREMRSGISEAVKVALIKDDDFFTYLYDNRAELAAFKSGPMEEMIHRCAALHMSHIGSGGDPFELGSARPLDFGHWSAHHLEEITDGRLNHGEAVSIGMALDSLYSQAIGLIGEEDLRTILSLLAQLGLPLWHSSLARLDLEGALGAFQEHLGGDLAITLLTGIGSKKEVNYIDSAIMRECLEKLVHCRHEALGAADPLTTAATVEGRPQ